MSQININVHSNSESIDILKNHASIFSSVMSLSNSVIGAGLLSLPFAVGKCGYLVGTIMVIVISIIGMLGLYMLMYAASFEKESTNWSHLGWKTMPKTMKIVDFLCLLGNIGTCAGYLIIIGDLMPDATRHILNESNVNYSDIFVNRHFWICIFILFVLPLVPKTTFNNLRYFSTLAIVCFAYIFVMCQLYAYIPALEDDLDPITKNISATPVSALDFLKVMPILFTAFSCHMNAIAVSSELKNPTSLRIKKSIFYSMSLCAIFYASVGLAGYLTFGDKIKSDILLNYPETWLVTVLRVSLSIAITFSYPMWCAPSRESFCFLVYGKKSTELDKKQFYIITYGIVIVTFIIAMLVHDLGLVVALIGSGSSTSTMYIMPGFLYYYIVPNQSKISKRIVVLWGIAGCIMLPTLTALQFL